MAKMTLDEWMAESRGKAPRMTLDEWMAESRGKAPRMTLDEWMKNSRNPSNTAESTIAVPSAGKNSAGDGGKKWLIGNAVGSGAVGAAADMLETAAAFSGSGQLTIGEQARAGYTQRELNDAQNAKNQRIRQNVQKPMQQASAKLHDTSAKLLENAKQGRGAAGQFAADLVAGGTQLGLDMALNAVAPGSAIGALGVRAFGGGVYDARQQGKSENEQFWRGASSAAIEAATEKLTGGLSGKLSKVYGKGVANGITEAIAAKLGKTTAGRAAILTLGGAMGEGAEEALSDVLNKVADRIIGNAYGEKQTGQIMTVEDWAQAGYDALVGAALGAISNGIGSVQAARYLPTAEEITRRSAQAATAAQSDLASGDLTTQQENAVTEQETASEEPRYLPTAEEILAKGQKKNKNAVPAWKADESAAYRRAREAGIDTLKLLRLGEEMTAKVKGTRTKAAISKKMADTAVDIAEKLQQGATGSDVIKSIEPLAMELTKSQLTVDGENKAEIEEIRKFLRGRKLKLDEQYAGDVEIMGGKGVLTRAGVRLNENGRSVDTVYTELTESFGERYFPSDIVNPADQVERIAKVLQTNTVEEIDPAEYEALYEENLERLITELYQMAEVGNRTAQTRREIAENVAAWNAEESQENAATGQETATEEPRYLPTAEEILERGQKNAAIDRAGNDLTTREGAAAAMAQRQAQEQEKLNNAGNYQNTAPEGTALHTLGVKIAGDQGDYFNAGSLRAQQETKKRADRAVKKLEKKLRPTDEERNFAKDVANERYSMKSVPTDIKGKVEVLAKAYLQQREAHRMDGVERQRRAINRENDAQAAELFRNVDDTRVKEKSMVVQNEMTPQRLLTAMFGKEQGGKFINWMVKPAQQNEAELGRFLRRQLDDMRTFADKDGKQSALTDAENAVVQVLLEGDGIPAQLKSMDESGRIRNAVDNILNGESAEDAYKEERDLSGRYTQYMKVQDAIARGDYDAVKLDNAKKAFQEKYNLYYEAINDFLEAHGFDTIGFIPNYAPHMQSEAVNRKLASALGAMGIETEVANMMSFASQMMGVTDKVSTLPTSISGLTADFKPGKRFDPNFMERKGKETKLNATEGFQNYINYLAGVLYHTDDIARWRAMERYLRKTYSSEEISNQLSQAEMVKNGTRKEQVDFLRAIGKIKGDSDLSDADISDRLEEAVTELYDNVKSMTKYGEFVKWVTNYANTEFAGKQSYADRGREWSLGRKSLGVSSRIMSIFGRANVACNLGSVLNQTAQLADIQAEVPQRYILRAVADIARMQTSGGKIKGIKSIEIFNESDFLSSRKGIDMIIRSPMDKITDALFKPADAVDGYVSALAYQSKYNEMVARGLPEAAARVYADDWAQQIMGSRARGSRPAAFANKGVMNQMLHQFQIESSNSLQHYTIDQYGKMKEIKAEHGKKAAYKYAGTVLLKRCISAAVLNGVVGAISGGSPAPFDFGGYLLKFLASGLGMTEKEFIKGGGLKLLFKTLFDGDDEREFDGQKAGEELAYEVGNDIPYLRNILGLLGASDETTQVQGITETLEDVGEAVKNNGLFSGETLDSVMKAGASVNPIAGKQIYKTYEGAKTIARGGSYKGWGDDKKLQYAVEPTAKNVTKALLFGTNALEEKERYYAAGGKAMSANQTKYVDALTDAGMRKTEAADEVRYLQKVEGTRDKNGKTIQNSKKENVIAHIQSLNISEEAKNLLYMAAGYGRGTIDETPWYTSPRYLPRVD